MLRNITLGQYFPGSSVVHRLDPRTKILFTLFFVVVLLVVSDFIGYALLTGLVGAIVMVSAVPPRYLFRGLRPVVFILLFTGVVHLFMTPGRPLFRLGFLTATSEGLWQGVLMGYRVLLLVVTTSLLTLTTSPIALTDGIERLLRPLRVVGVPAHELAMMMTIALRFVPTLLDETERIMKAQMARGADFGTGNIAQRARSLVPLLVPLFISAFRHADELALAMESRCYRGGARRTRMRELRFGTGDYLALALIVASLGGLAYLRLLRGG